MAINDFYNYNLNTITFFITRMIRNIFNFNQNTRKFLTNQLNKFFFTTTTHNIQNILQKYYQRNQLLPGYATQQATSQYKRRIISKGKVHESFYTKIQNTNTTVENDRLFISSLGIGTQNGDPTYQVDKQMLQILIQSMSSGINYIDSDINFRFGKSQKLINTCLNYLVKQENFNRQQFFITTKLGYIPTDIDSQLSSQKLISLLKSQGFLKDQHLVQGIYGWGDGFLDFSIEKSRLALGVQTIDCVMMNNFSQANMALVNQQQFYRRMATNLRKLQQAKASNRIRNYGLCSFVGLRSPPIEQGVHLNLQKVCNFAKDTVGSNNGFKYIMLPLNLGMPEALLKWQKYIKQTQQETLRIFDVAQRQGLKLIICSPLFQGRVSKLPFSSTKLNYLSNNASKHLQFIRSINSSALVSTVFSTLNMNHLKENLQVMKYDKLSNQDWKGILPIPQ